MFYDLLRNLHLYLGLFISPFLLLFSISVFFLNHAKLDPAVSPESLHVGNLRLPDDVDRRQGAGLVAPAVDVLNQVGIQGEITSIRSVRADRHFVFTVGRPGLDATIDVDLAAKDAVVSRRVTGALESMSYLHKMPGPHNAAIRGNWIWTIVWRVFADATVYLILFLSLSGLYLWWVLKNERRIGFALLSGGAVTMAVLMYVAIR